MAQKEKKYEKALVIFIDILGSKNQTNFDTLYDINNIFHKELENNMHRNPSHVIYERTIHTFSDCAYIIYSFKSNTPKHKQSLSKLFEVALCNCEDLLVHFINNNFVFRGGVTYGDVYYEKERSLLFGPAINNAYNIENKEAIYPRIVIEEFVATKILEHWEEKVKKMDNPQTPKEKEIYNLLGNIVKQQGCIVKKDFDGKYMLHFLNAIETNTSLFAFTNKTNEEFVKSIIEFSEEQIQQNRNDSNITKKYHWLLNYVNSVISLNK